MALVLGQIAELVGGELHGDAALPITGAAILRDAHPGDLTLADKPELAAQLAKSSASAVLVPPHFQPQTLPFVAVRNVHQSFAKVVEHFRPPPAQRPRGLSPAAHISPTARIAADVDIHAGAAIGDDVEIGCGTTIHSGVRILAGCRIGEHVTIFPNAVLYEQTRVGNRVIIHANAVLGAYGFGYETVEGRHRLSAQLGYVDLGDDVEIGAGTTIDRGTYGPTTIGEGTKIDNLVMIGHNCRIGRHNLLCGQVGIAGSCTTGDYVIMAGQVGLADHLDIGDRAILCAQAGVMNDLPADGIYLGSPARKEREQLQIMAATARLPEMRKELRTLQRQVESLTRKPEAA